MVNFVWRKMWFDRRCLRSLKKHLFAVWILRCISRLTSFVGVIKDPSCPNSLTTSMCLSPIATLCPTSRIVLSFRAALSFVHLFLTLLWLLFPMLSKHPDRLTDSYRRYLYHRNMRVVFLCCRLCRLFVGLLVI
jgi:hypothetical protein